MFFPAGRAEEKTGGRSQLPWRDVYSEIPGQPGPLGRTGGGRGAVNGLGRELPHGSVGLVGHSRVGWAPTSFP